MSLLVSKTFDTAYTFYMESKNDDTLSPAEQLERYAQVQRRAEDVHPTRAYWSLMLWSAALIAVYAAVYLFIFGGGNAGGYPTTAVMITPVLAFSSLVTGARERFSIRSKPSAFQWVISGICLAGFMAIGALSVAGVAYPQWWNVVIPVMLFLALAVAPIRGLMRTTRERPATWQNEPLSARARWMTVLIGIAIGALIVTSTHPLASALTGVIVMLFLLIVLIGWRSRFGLPRTGYEWGPLHWSSFGVSAALVFLSVVLSLYAPWFTAPHLVGTGVIVILIMAVAAVLPRGGANQDT